MPLCIESARFESTSASHRPVLSPLTALLLQELEPTSLHDGDKESVASTESIKTAQILVTEVPFNLIGRPDVSPYYGEVHLTWRLGNKQIVLMCFSSRTPLVHHHPNDPQESAIEEATGDRLSHWLRWLRA